MIVQYTRSNDIVARFKVKGPTDNMIVSRCAGKLTGRVSCVSMYSIYSNGGVRTRIRPVGADTHGPLCVHSLYLEMILYGTNEQ